MTRIAYHIEGRASQTSRDARLAGLLVILPVGFLAVLVAVPDSFAAAALLQGRIFRRMLGALRTDWFNCQPLTSICQERIEIPFSPCCCSAIL